MSEQVAPVVSRFHVQERQQFPDPNDERALDPVVIVVTTLFFSQLALVALSSLGFVLFLLLSFVFVSKLVFD